MSGIKKDENFSEWYNEVVEEAGLTDKRYPIKGMNVWPAYGWKIMRYVDSYIREELDATHHDEVCFPLLIPQTEFQKEKEHIKGFDAEVYWVTKAGDNELDIPLVLRPTSETAMYPMFSLWIRSHSDLPLKIYQLVNTFRYETKQTRAFMRVREIHFFESHTCHVDEEDAQKQIEEDIQILSKIAKKLCMPYMLLKRTEWDKFPGAYYTVGIDTTLVKGRSLQLGSIHHYHENFSKPFDIKYEDLNGELKYVHQTTYGMSERLLGAVIGVHGDDKGLVLPPAIAPFQVVIIPILAKGNVEEVEKQACILRDELRAAGIRVELDDGDERPGNKFFKWELKGVPLRLELGERDIKNGVVAFARRFDARKGSFQRSDVVNSVKAELDKIAEEMDANAWKKMKESVVSVDNLENPPEMILRFGWCGDENCGKAIEEKTGLKILGTPYIHEEFHGKCAGCGKDTDIVVYSARAM